MMVAPSGFANETGTVQPGVVPTVTLVGSNVCCFSHAHEWGTGLPLLTSLLWSSSPNTGIRHSQFSHSAHKDKIVPGPKSGDASMDWGTKSHWALLLPVFLQLYQTRHKVRPL